MTEYELSERAGVEPPMTEDEILEALERGSWPAYGSNVLSDMDTLPDGFINGAINSIESGLHAWNYPEARLAALKRERDRRQFVVKCREWPDGVLDGELKRLMCSGGPLDAVGQMRLEALRTERDRRLHEAQEHPVPDPVNHPAHYKAHPSGVECIEITEHLSFLRGNAIKYLWRAGQKGNLVEDLEKAKWYIEREIELERRKADD